MTEGCSHEVRLRERKGGEGLGSQHFKIGPHLSQTACFLLSRLCLGLLLLLLDVRYSDIIICASWIGANAPRTLPAMGAEKESATYLECSLRTKKPHLSEFCILYTVPLLVLMNMQVVTQYTQANCWPT